MLFVFLLPLMLVNEDYRCISQTIAQRKRFSKELYLVINLYVRCINKELCNISQNTT